MTIFGVALLALCTLVGNVLGDLLGAALHVQANVGGVGIAMILLISARLWLVKRRLLDPGMTRGIDFWGALYIPIVVAMAATQNVISAVMSGPLVAAAAILAVIVCFAAVAVLSRLGGPTETMDQIEARERAAPSLATSGMVD